jgi:hypothetical protein
MVQSEIRLPPPGWAEGGVRILSSNADYTDGAHVTPPRHGAPTELGRLPPPAVGGLFSRRARQERESATGLSGIGEGFDQPRRSSQTGTSKGCSHRSNRDRGCIFRECPAIRRGGHRAVKAWRRDPATENNGAAPDRRPVRWRRPIGQQRAWWLVPDRGCGQSAVAEEGKRTTGLEVWGAFTGRAGAATGTQ